MLKKFYIQISFLFALLAVASFWLIFFYLDKTQSLKEDDTKVYDLSLQANNIDEFRRETKDIFVHHNQTIKNIEDDSFSFLVLGLIFISGILMNIIPLFVVSINTILDGITKFKQGDRGHQIQLNSESEFGEIADYLNKTFKTVDEYEREIGELISIASHQLKAPITVAKGNIEMLLENDDKNLTDEQIKMLGDIYKTQQNMNVLVNDLLDVARLDKNEMKFELEKTDPLAEIKVVIENLGDYAKKNELNMAVEKEAEGKFIMADKFRIGQVFQNLIDNAIRYSSSPAKIEISIKSSGSKLKIGFKDNGIGIPEKEKINIFNRFYRASNAIQFKGGGTGLGLYIIKSMTEKMNGKIWFESEENKGTTFFLEFPITQTT